MLWNRTTVNSLSRLISGSGLCGLVALACSGETGTRITGDLAWEARYDTLGDTVVVHTISGSIWGDTAELVPEVTIGMLDGPEEYTFGQVSSLARAEDGTIYVVDRQVPALRVYEPDGSYRTTFGGPGDGPGEYDRPDGGLNVLSDGRVLLRDPGNARIQVYSPAGEPLDEWRIRGGFNTSARMIVDPDDRTYTLILLDVEADVRDWRSGLVQMLPDGSPGDTLERPDTGFEGSRIEARFTDDEGGTSASITNVPFTASEYAELTPRGYFFHAINTEYAVTLLKPEAPLRIEKAWDPVPVTRGEKAEARAFAVRDMRRTDPAWSWDGDPIPDTKPPYSAVYAGEDGTIWVRVSQPAVKREDPYHDPSDPESIADEWREPWLFDVFDEDGRYLGAVRAPDEFRTHPRPIFTRDEILATVRDEYDVQSVVRFRVALPEDEG